MFVIAMARGLFRAESLFEAFYEARALRRRELSLRVKGKIDLQGHPPVTNHLPRLVAVLLVTPPFRDVEERPSFIDVVLDQPGHGSDVAIPGPHGSLLWQSRQARLKIARVLGESHFGSASFGGFS